MQSATRRETLNGSARTLIRILIASYFIASVTGLVPGFDPSVLFSEIIPAPYDSWTGMGLGLLLSFAILTGHFLRPAALLLSLALFWSSYLTAIELGLAEQFGSFWRDLALIGALLLTYTEPESRTDRPERLITRKPKVRRLKPSSPVAPKRVAGEKDPNAPIRFPKPDAHEIEEAALAAEEPGAAAENAAEESDDPLKTAAG